MEAIWEKLHDAATCASSAKVDVIELAEYFKTMLKCVSQDRTNVTRITNERLDILIELMKRYEEVVNIQVHGTALIWNLAAADETKKDYLRQTNKAAIDIIFGNLNCFKDVLALHDYAIGALWSLAAGSQPTTAEIVSRRGIELVLEKLTAFPDSKGVAERGTGCLSVLMALDEKATVLAVASGIIPTIISVMRKFGSELNIIQAASVILKRISLVKGEDSSYKLSQASSKIVDIATIFMKTFPENTLIIDSFLNTLVCCITENEAATKQALNQQSVNSVSAILSSMAKFPDKLSIQANGTTLLFSMSVDEQLMASILENGGLEIVVNNFKKPYSSNAVILENGIGCIWSLSSVETVRLELASPLNDTISLLIGLLTKNISNPGAQSKGNALLWNLAGTPQSRSKVIESGGIELINLNTAAHSNDASIMEYGRGALWALQQPPALDGAVLAKDTNDFDLKSPSKEFPAPSTLSNCMDGNHLNSASAPITDPIILLQSLHTEDSESIDFLLDILKRADNQATVDTCCNTLLNYTKSCEKNRAYLTARNAVPILTVCMKKFPDVASIQKNCTCALHNLAMIESNRTKNIIENEGIVLALTALKRFSDAPPVQESCLALLSILSSELQNKTAIASHSGLEIIVSTMEKYSNNPIILESSNVVLASMAEGSEDFCSVIVRCGAIALIASSAQQFPNSPGLQVSALSALTILASKSMQNKFTIAQVHGLEIGLNALQVSDVNVLERAISLLSHLVENVERNKQTIFKSHGVEMVIDVMKRFSNAQTIQHNGQLFLCNMLKHDKHGIKDLASEIGGCSIIADNIGRFPDALNIQETGINLLSQLATIDENQEVICKLGGIGFIIASMARFKENDVIQAKANLSLWSLAVKDASRLAIARAGGIQLVIESMRRFPENLVVIEAGHGALWNLARDEENRNLISQMSGVDILIQNLARFNCDVDINVRGLGALWSLNDVEANREKLIKMGGINIIANAIKNLSEESTEIAENGFGCLLSMSKSDIAKQAMMDSKVVSLVISYMKKYSDNKIIAEKGNGLLWDISRNMSYIPIISEEGGFDCLLSIMRHHDDSLPIIENGVGALSSFSKDEKSRVALGILGAILLLVNIMNSFKMEPRLIERCQGCLWNLGVTDANKKFIIESGAPFYVVGNMIEYKHSEGILSSGAGVLSSLIPDARLMKDLLGSDVLQTLQQAVTEFPRNPVLSSKGSQLIAALMENGLRTRSATTNAPVSPTSPLVDQQQRMRSTSGSAVTNTTNSGSTYIQASSFATIRSNAGLDAFRTWEDTTGKFKIEGKFHNLQNENLILLQVNGGTKSIPISKLSQKDQDFVKMMAASAVAQSDCETPAINNTSEFSPIPRGAQTVIRSAPPPPIPVSSPAATVRNQRPPPPPPPATASPASQTMRGAPPPIPSSHASQIMRAIPSTSSPFTRGSSRESISSIEGGIQKSTPPQTELDLSDSRSSGSIMSSRPSIANITSTGSPVTPLPVQFATSTASSTANANTTLRVWQDVSGKFKIEASYSSSNNGDVMLKQTNGVIITIPITKLCQADSDYIMNHLSLSLSGAAAESKLNSVAPLLKLASTSIGSTDSLSRAQEGYSFEDIDNHSHPADLIDPHIYINARKHWTENSGQGRSVEGFYHGFAWGKVLIKTTQGKLKGIPLKSLCNEDMEIVKAILYGKPITVGAASNNIPALPSAAIEPKLRVWEDSTGKFKIDAIYQSTENGVVFLKQHPSGAILKVPRSKLRQSDLEYIDSLNGCSIVPPRQASQDSLNRSNNSGSPATPPSAIPSSRIWQDASGKFKIEGTFKETSNGNVVIKQTNGAILTVPISKLCFTDAEYILNLKEKEKQLAKEAKLYSERELHAVQVIEKFARTYLDCRVARKERVRLLEEKAKNEMKQEQEKKAAAARLIDEQEKEQARLEQERKTELAREWEEKMQREREEKSRLEAALAQVEEEKKRMADLLAAQELKAAAVTVSPITAAASNSSNFASSTSAIPTTVSLNQQSLETLRTSNPAAYNFWMDNFLVPDPVDKDTFLTALEIHTGQEISLPMIKTSMVEPRIFKMLVSGKGPLVPHFQN